MMDVHFKPPGEPPPNVSGLSMQHDIHEPLLHLLHARFLSWPGHASRIQHEVFELNTWYFSLEITVGLRPGAMGKTLAQTRISRVSLMSCPVC